MAAVIFCAILQIMSQEQMEKNCWKMVLFTCIPSTFCFRKYTLLYISLRFPLNNYFMDHLLPFVSEGVVCTN